LFCVPTTVNFNDQSSIEADKVGDVGTYWHLPAEGSVTEPMRAKQIPQPTLRICHSAAKRASIGTKMS
jgi:hypothetical protein